MYTVQTSRPAPVERVALLPLTPPLRAELERVAAADRHPVIHPTHAVVKAGRVVGYASAGAVPMFFAWMDRQHATARDSFTAWQLAEDAMRSAGHRVACLPCEAASPFAPYLEKRNYRTVGTALFNLKEFYVL